MMEHTHTHTCIIIEKKIIIKNYYNTIIINYTYSIEKISPNNYVITSYDRTQHVMVLNFDLV